MNSVNKGCGLVGLLLFLGIFIMVGVGLFLWGLTILQQARISQNWPTTSGQVVSSAVREESDEDGTTFYGDVRYQYTANDRRYASDNVSFGQYGGSRNHATEIVNRYRPGQPVTVYYNPEEPETAVLEPGVTWSSALILVIGLLFVGLPTMIGTISIMGAIRPQ